MSQDPAFLFYPNDYLGGTMGFSFDMHGAYLMLLIYQFNNGHFKEAKARQIVGKLFDKIKHKFAKDENELLYNERLEEEIKKRKIFSDSRRKNAQERWNKKKKDASALQKNTSAMHMEK